jgi:hypothetical protein
MGMVGTEKTDTSDESGSDSSESDSSDPDEADSDQESVHPPEYCDKNGCEGILPTIPDYRSQDGKGSILNFCSSNCFGKQKFSHSNNKHRRTKK